MISVIVVYNDAGILNDVLLKSLRQQRGEYELLAVDNAGGKFSSAAGALNSAAAAARGRYLMFVHQDVELDGPDWLEDAEGILDGLEGLGAAGVVGMAGAGKGFKGKYVGYIDDGGTIRSWSRKRDDSVRVQTLDECLLLVPREAFLAAPFDEGTFDGWHCYGVDYCLGAQQRGLTSYVIPKFVRHRSGSTNSHHLFRYQLRLHRKYAGTFGRIYTTCGEISTLKLPILYLKSKIVNVPLIRPLYFYLRDRPLFLD